MQRFVRSLPVAVLLFLINASPHAQVNITGMWRPLARNEDGSGMDGDYAGLPLNAAGRWRAQSWSPENFDVAEWVCRPHAWDFSVEADASRLRFWAGDRRPDPGAHRASRAPLDAGTGDDDLDGRPAASARLRAAHVERLLDRRVGRSRWCRPRRTSRKRTYAAGDRCAATRRRCAPAGSASADYLRATVIIYDPVYLDGPTSGRRCSGSTIQTS